MVLLILYRRQKRQRREVPVYRNTVFVRLLILLGNIIGQLLKLHVWIFLKISVRIRLCKSQIFLNRCIEDFELGPP